MSNFLVRWRVATRPRPKSSTSGSSGNTEGGAAAIRDRVSTGAHSRERREKSAVCPVADVNSKIGRRAGNVPTSIESFGDRGSPRFPWRASTGCRRQINHPYLTNDQSANAASSRRTRSETRSRSDLGNAVVLDGSRIRRRPGPRKFTQLRWRSFSLACGRRGLGTRDPCQCRAEARGDAGAWSAD
jgi:hypothetical protein